MARKNRRNKSSSKKNTSTTGASSKATSTSNGATQAPTHSEEVTALEKKAEADGLTPVPSIVAPKEDYDELRKRLDGLIAAYGAKHEELDERELKLMENEEALSEERKKAAEKASEIARGQDALDEAQASLESERSTLKAEREQIDTKRAGLETLRKELVEREEAIAKREADAEAGFLKRREEALKLLNGAHDELLKKNEELAAELVKKQDAHTTALLQREEEHRASLEERSQKLEEDFRANKRTIEAEFAKLETELKEREEAARQQARKADQALQAARWETEDAEALKGDIRKLIEERAEDRVSALQQQLEDLRARAQERLERSMELERELEKCRDAARALSNESPEVTARRLEKQEQEITRLRDELSNRPTATEADELKELRDERKRLEDERRTLREEVSRLNRQLETRNIDIDETEILRDRNRALLENQRLLSAALDDLRSDIDERLDKHRDQPVFPELLGMDEDAELSEPHPRLWPSGSRAFSLKTFANDLRHRVGRDPEGQRPDLYYRHEDIRAFMGGLAMSRLHLLQGISGIGKSSLPRRFAQAVGGFCQTISVQAGWRDRNDLLGYFNAFERRYYESAFVQALYKAQTPRWKDRPVIVLLDEMNLSHPEQYAADVLDVLERKDPSDRRFELMSARQKGRDPERVIDGRYIPLPDNVWFVGTANHDETTKDFADKTYDRSFVMELPGQPKPFKLSDPRPRDPLSYTALLDAFDQAAEDHADKAAEAMGWMKKHLRGPMSDGFGVGWGGRLESQIKRYVPVVVAAGGSLGEAMDQLVTMRVLRRIRGRHDLLEEDLRVIRDLLQNKWPDADYAPTAGLALLDRELKRLGAEL